MTTKELVEKLNQLIEKHPTLADVQVIGGDDLSIEYIGLETEDDEIMVKIE